MRPLRRGYRTLTAVASAALLLGGCGTTAPDDQPTDAASVQGADSGSTQATVEHGPTEETGAEETGAEETGAEGTGAEETGAEDTDAEAHDTEASWQDLGTDGIPGCDVLDLPATALNTIEDIEVGGPYEFPRNDGGTFQNREGILPDENRAYYREFTVVTPDLDHRGARRIVTGGPVETDPDHWYYTDDHYESFCEFDPAGLDD